MSSLTMLRALAVVASLLGLLLAGPARAGGRVLVAPGAGLFVRAARVAQAQAPQWTTRWLSLDVGGGPGRFVVVVPTPAGTRVDPALDAFFTALDAATAPRVRPPKPVLACGATTDGSIEDTSQPLVSSVPAGAVAVLDDVDAVAAFANQQGVAFGADDASALGAGPFVALVYDLAEATGSTETLRVVVPAADSRPGLALLTSADVPDVTLFTLAEGRAALGSGVDEIGAPALGTQWNVLSGTSTYVADRRGFLLAASGGVALIESSGAAPLFGWNVLPGGAGALPPAVKTYFDSAKKDGAGIVAPDLCAQAVADALASGKAGVRVSRACAPGALAVVPDPPGAKPCDETALPGESPAAALRCGDADDLAHAFAGLRVDAVRVTRHATVAGASTPAELDIGIGDGPAVSLLVTAASANTSGCVNGNAGASGAGGFTGGAGYGGSGGGPGHTVGVDDGLPPPEPEPHVDVSCWVAVDDSCAGDGSGESADSCSGDSSGDPEGDACSGDSSGDPEGDTCSGDSSSSDAEGDTCAADSSSGAEGDTCAGDGGDGDGCGSGASGSGSDCALPRRPRRVRVSALVLLFAAVALPLRRRSRRSRGRR